MKRKRLAIYTEKGKETSCLELVIEINRTAPKIECILINFSLKNGNPEHVSIKDKFAPVIADETGANL